MRFILLLIFLIFNESNSETLEPEALDLIDGELDFTPKFDELAQGVVVDDADGWIGRVF